MNDAQLIYPNRNGSIINKLFNIVLNCFVIIDISNRNTGENNNDTMNNIINSGGI